MPYRLQLLFLIYLFHKYSIFLSVKSPNTKPFYSNKIHLYLSFSLHLIYCYKSYKNLKNNILLQNDSFLQKQMLKLEKVSKFKKQQISKKIKKTNQQLQKFQSQTKYPVYQHQIDPQIIYNIFFQQEGTSYSQKQYEINYNNRQFQDSILTMFIYKKITLVRYTMMSLGIISIFLSIFSKQLHAIQTQILILHSIITVLLIIMIFVKYFLKEELKKKQLLREKNQNQIFKFLKSTIIQFIIITMHPNILMRDIFIQVPEPIYGNSIPLKINNFFEVLMQLRIYLLFLSIINSSIYCNTRAHRLCRIYSTKNSLFFGVKSLFQYKPLTFLIVLYFSLVLALGQMISLSQRIYQQDFQVFQNSLWFIIITMGTVGYGDYSPKTYLGRAISFTAAISGIIISSLLILTLSRYLSMSNGQNKSHVTLKRLQLRKVLEKFSQQTIDFTTKMMFQNGLKGENKNSQQNKRVMQELKKKTQRVKFAIRRIKNIVDTDNLKQEINRLFEALSQSLNQIYKYQQQYSQLLVQLYHRQKDIIQQIQFSFTTEIENIIKDK